MPGKEKHFHVSRMLQCCCKFMKMLFCELFLTLAQWQTTPGIHCNGLREKVADPTQEAGWGVRILILITNASFSHLFLLKTSGLGAESMGPSMIFTILLLTSYDKQHHLVPQVPRLTCFPAFHLCCVFEPGLKAATLKPY